MGPPMTHSFLVSRIAIYPLRIKSTLPRGILGKEEDGKPQATTGSDLGELGSSWLKKPKDLEPSCDM